MQVAGKRVLITGAGRGLGEAMARRFAAAGAEVVAADLDAAVVALPLAAAYAATKAAVLAFSDSLREELRLTGRRHVGVTAVCPSYVATGLFEGARPARLTRLLDPDAVAAAVVRAVGRNQD